MDFIDLLGDPAYRHVLFNHVPVVGLVVAFLILAIGVALRRAETTVLGLVLVALTAGAGLPVARFGEAAYPAIYDTLDGHGRAWLDHHAEVAETWLPLLYADAGLAMAALAAGASRRRLLLPSAALVLVLSAGSIVAVALVAQTGGKIQHPEFRLDPLPP